MRFLTASGESVDGDRGDRGDVGELVGELDAGERSVKGVPGDDDKSRDEAKELAEQAGEAELKSRR